MEPPPVRYTRTYDGYDIAYTDSGKGQPLIWVSGPTGHVRLDWLGPRRPTLEQLAEGFRLICFDGRGQGMSTRGLGPDFKLSDDEIDLEAVVEATGVDRFVLFGVLYYSHVAARYAAKHPERVKALVLFNSRLGGPPGDGAVTGGRGTSLTVTMAAENWDLYVETIARTAYPHEDPESAVRRIRASQNQADSVIHAIASTDSSIGDIVGSLKVPTLLVATQGQILMTSSHEAAQTIAALIPGARLELFSDEEGGLNSTAPGTKPIVSAIQRLLAGLPAEETNAGSRTEGLSPRELDVLRLVARGRSNQQIADELVISLNTVMRHVSNILTKIEATNRTEAAGYARDHGLI